MNGMCNHQQIHLFKMNTHVTVQHSQLLMDYLLSCIYEIVILQHS